MTLWKYIAMPLLALSLGCSNSDETPKPGLDEKQEMVQESTPNYFPDPKNPPEKIVVNSKEELAEIIRQSHPLDCKAKSTNCLGINYLKMADDCDNDSIDDMMFTTDFSDIVCWTYYVLPTTTLSPNDKAIIDQKIYEFRKNVNPKLDELGIKDYYFKESGIKGQILADTIPYPVVFHRADDCYYP